jgi:hypothetical protein
VARETDLEERQRKDEEKAAENRARQARLGGTPVPAAEEEEEKPKSRSRSRAKKS